MSDATIDCPHCFKSFKLTETLAAPFVEQTRQKFAQEFQTKEAEFEKRLAAFAAQREAAEKARQAIEAERTALAKQREEMDEQVAQRLKAEREKLATEAAQRDAAIRQREERLAKEREAVDATVAEKVKSERDKLAAEAARRAQALQEREAALAREREAVDASVAEKLKAEREKLAAESAKREQAVRAREAELARAKEAMDAEVAEKLKAERGRIEAEAAKRAKLAVGDELEQKSKAFAELQEVLQQREAKLAEAQKAQAELLRKERELDDAKREMELTIEKRIGESLGKTREQAKREAEESLSLRIAEKEQTIASMQQKIEELKKKAEQGSQQLQGEVLELDLEAKLTAKFPHDTISPVPKGEFGGDVVQRVIIPSGVACGTILWESKRTKNWQDGWLAKLREDQRQAKAEIAVIVSTVLPKGVDHFDQVDGVWIVHPRCVLPVAMSLRHMLVEVHGARQAGEGQQTKMEMVYHYLTGPKFRLRVQAIVEAFSSMEEDLAKEKKLMLKQWSKREEQIARVTEATVGMYGELQGIAGKSLQEIEGLELDGAVPNKQPLLET